MQSAEWNRGAYIVNGLGHCGACHTPKSLLSGDEYSKALQGGKLENFLASDLTGDKHDGLGGWEKQDVVDFLKTGINGKSSAARRSSCHSAAGSTCADFWRS